MTTGAAPGTGAGRAAHDSAWNDPNDVLSEGHTSAREGCPACAVLARIEAEARQQVDTDDAYKRGYHDGVDAGEAQERERIRAALRQRAYDPIWAHRGPGYLAESEWLAILDAPAGDHETDVSRPGEQK